MNISHSNHLQRQDCTVQDEIEECRKEQPELVKLNYPTAFKKSHKIKHRPGIDHPIINTCVYPPINEQISRVKKRCSIKQRCINTKNLHAGKVNLLKRCFLSQKQYMKILAKPNIRCFNRPSRRKIKHRCILDSCPYRITQLARPKKQLVVNTWRDYGNILGPETIQRFHKLLLEPERNRFRMSVKELHLLVKKQRCMKKRKKVAKIRNKRIQLGWLVNEIKKTARVIINYFICQPELNLGVKQLMISSVIMNSLNKKKVSRRPLSRQVTRAYPSSLVDICDKLAVWIDSICSVIDLQPIDMIEMDDRKESDVWDFDGEEGEDNDYDFYEIGNEEEPTLMQLEKEQK